MLVYRCKENLLLICEQIKKILFNAFLIINTEYDTLLTMCHDDDRYKVY